MSNLIQAIRLIEQEVAVQRACCVIADEGCPDESTLLGTRDGYLNLALALLRFVADADAGNCQEDPEHKRVWDDRVKDVMYQLPTNNTWLVGTSLFEDHTSFMAALKGFVEPQIRSSLLNDPQFRDPADQDD